MIVYEIALQQCGGQGEYESVRLAYWDIALDAVNPAESEIFSDSFFGGNGNQAEGSCVQVGQFAGKINVFPEEQCLRRDFDLEQFVKKGNAEATIGAHFCAAELKYETAQGRNRTFDYFRNYLESTVCLSSYLRFTRLYISESEELTGT
jgi:hypothetical protein